MTDPRKLIEKARSEARRPVSGYPDVVTIDPVADILCDALIAVLDRLDVMAPAERAPCLIARTSAGRVILSAVQLERTSSWPSRSS